MPFAYRQERLALATPRGDSTVADRLETDRARLASMETQVCIWSVLVIC